MMNPMEARRSSSNGMAKLTYPQAQRIRAAHAKGAKPKDLAVKYGVSRNCIYDVLSGRRHALPPGPPVPARAHRAKRNHR